MFTEKNFSRFFSDLPRSPIETFESIDQMRIIENGEDLLSINLINGYPGINEPREEKLVRKILSNDNVQREVLAKIFRLNEKNIFIALSTFGEFGKEPLEILNKSNISYQINHLVED